jgi:hypothetical protein
MEFQNIRSRDQTIWHTDTTLLQELQMLPPGLLTLWRHHISAVLLKNSSSLSAHTELIVSSQRMLIQTQHRHYQKPIVSHFGARGRTIDWGSMLQTVRSRGQLLMRSLDFRIHIFLSVALGLGFIKSLSEMSARNFPGGTGRPTGS